MNAPHTRFVSDAVIESELVDAFEQIEVSRLKRRQYARISSTKQRYFKIKRADYARRNPFTVIA